MKKRCLLLFLFCLFCGGILFAHYPKREMRGAWIATVANIDWPAKEVFDALEQQRQLLAILDTLMNNKINMIVFQVRPTADAFYQSSLEPWSHWLTGVQGTAPHPFYDPLAFVIEEAHARCMDVHVWLNPYRVTNQMDTAILTKKHLFHKHRDWFVEYGDKWYFNPGLDETRLFLNQVVADIVQRYDVDAIHFDDYFYPYKIKGKDFPDETTFKKHPRGFTDKEAWRRNNVDMVIAELQHTIKSIKPWVEFGISPFGVWRNKSSDPRGSATQAGAQNYDDLYADILKWLQEGTIDYVAPQLYWEIGTKVADYEILAKWWSDNSYGRNLYIGLYASQLTNPKAPIAWRTPNELARQLRLNKRHKEIDGCVFYSTQALMKNPQGLCDSLQQVFYPYDALPPMNRNITPDTSAAPYNLRQLGQGENTLLLWNVEEEQGGCAIAHFVVYAFEGDTIGDINNPKNILCKTTARGLPLRNYLHRLPHNTYTFVVTSLNKYKVESAHSNIIHWNKETPTLPEETPAP